MLLIAAFAMIIGKRIKFPFTIFLVVIGIGIAELANIFPSLNSLAGFKVSPEVILFVFLPTLIFESEFALDAKELRRNLPAILTLAIPGLLMSTVIIGGLVHVATGMDFRAALLLGAILSVTDPVAVISLFKSLGTPKRLTVLVEGESLFNDATAIVTSQILIAIALAGYADLTTVGDGLLSFF